MAERSRVIAAVVVTVVAALLIGVAVLAQSGGGGHEFEEVAAPPREVDRLDPAVERARCELERLESEGQAETTASVEYRSNPPHSGDHAAEPPADAAYYDNPPPDEALVHSLLHGRVVIWFDDELPERTKGALNAVYEEDPEHVLLVPRDEMPYEVAATAWTRRLGCAKARAGTYDAVRAFRDRFRDRGLEFVP